MCNDRKEFSLCAASLCRDLGQLIGENQSSRNETVRASSAWREENAYGTTPGDVFLTEDVRKRKGVRIGRNSHYFGQACDE